MEHRAEGGKERGWRFVFRRTGLARLAAAVLLVLGGVWLFLGILEDVLSGDPLVTVDRMLHQGLQGLRIPAFDYVMVGASALGDAAVVVPVFLVVLITLVLRREWRTAGYWVAAIAAAEISVKLLKFAVQRARPVSVYEGIEGFSFPSSHATLGIVVYGFLTYLVCRGRQRVAQFRIAVVSASVIVLIAFSRLYLGVHWFSDIVAGLSLGTAWIAFLSVAHHRAIVKSGVCGSVGMIRRPALEEPVCFRSPAFRPRREYPSEGPRSCLRRGFFSMSSLPPQSA